MKTKALLLILTPTLLFANPGATLVCEDQSKKVIVSTGYVPGKSEIVMSVNADPKPKLYSVRVIASHVIRGANGRHPEVPELRLTGRITKGFVVGVFKSDSSSKSSPSFEVFCK